MSAKQLSYAARQERIAELQVELQIALLEPIIADATERIFKSFPLEVIPELRAAIRNAVIDAVVALDRARLESYERIHQQ